MFRYRYRTLEQIQALDPEKDHQKIVLLSMRHDFPFDTTRALELALFRTFCVPSISALLDKTGEFQNRAQKRYDDTDIIVSELIEWGYDSDRGRKALRRMNQIHNRFNIANDDFLYVLSTFIFEPIRWNQRFGWRPLCDQERQAYFRFWSEIGRRMNIKQIPDDYATFDQFNQDYEQTHFHFTESNQRVGIATRELFTQWFPKPFAPLVRSAIYSLLDESMIQAFGFPKPPQWMRLLVPASVRWRGKIAQFWPASRQPSLRTNIQRPSYPNGYEIDRIGPPANAHSTTLGE